MSCSFYVRGFTRGAEQRYKHNADLNYLQTYKQRRQKDLLGFLVFFFALEVHLQESEMPSLFVLHRSLWNTLRPIYPTDFTPAMAQEKEWE